MNQKTYAVDIMGKEEATYITESDVVKLVQNTNKGARLVLVGKTFINPASISRIRRVYDIDANVVEETDEDVVRAIEGREPRLKIQETTGKTF